MEVLADLTLRGSAAVIIVLGLDRILSARMSSPSRRWWWFFIPLAFLVPFHLPLLPAVDRFAAITAAWTPPLAGTPMGDIAAMAPRSPHLSFIAILWLAGAIISGAVAIGRTVQAHRRWTRERLSTDHRLLELLEDCKAEAGVTAPIGLVISDSVSSPAILGWLHPRILLPASLAASMPGPRLRPILLHELAHFRWFDVPFNWLLTIVRAIHWFNPLAHWGAIAWTRFREEAADEAAVKWLKDNSGQTYGEALVQSLRETRGTPAPCGALAILESVRHLKRRIDLINRFPDKSPRVALTGAVSLLLGLIVFAKTGNSAAVDRAESAARASMQVWLEEIDRGEYTGGWRDASPRAQSYLSARQWVEKFDQVRTPLGKCYRRTQISSIFEKDPRWSPAGMGAGEFVVVEFNSAFENLAHAGETVTFRKEPDGTWKAYGYLIHP